MPILLLLYVLSASKPASKLTKRYNNKWYNNKAIAQSIHILIPTLILLYFHKMCQLILVALILTNQAFDFSNVRYYTKKKNQDNQNQAQLRII